MQKVRKVVARASRFFFVLVIVISAFVFAMFQGGVVSWTIFYAILPFMIYSIALFFYPLKDISVQRTIRTSTIRNGEKFEVKLLLKRKFRFPLLYTVIEEKWRKDSFMKTQDTWKKVFVFGFKKEVEWRYEIEGIPRGEHVLEGVRIEVIDFFGWVQKTRFIPSESVILVYPKMMNIHYVPLGAEYEQGAVVSPYSAAKDTTMATGVRDYQSGDRVSWIHWKSFARTQTLMTKEFEDRRTQDLLLVFDGRPSEVFEEQIEFAASTLQEAFNQRAGVKFLSLGAESILFSSLQSESQFREVLVHLAKIVPAENDDIEQVTDFRRELEHGGSVVVVTGSPDDPFLESVVANVADPRSITCFVVMKKGASMDEKVMKDIQLAKLKGIKVQTMIREEFSTAFREVTRS